MINKVILMGRLTADPELKSTTSGISVCRFTVAVNRTYKSKDGEQQADFLNVIAWRQSAEFVSRYFSKGSMIIVEGSLENNNYTDQNGVKHYAVNVRAEKVQFGETKKEKSEAPANTQTQKSAPTQKPTEETVSLGDLGDFEEILSDGEVPF